MSVAVWQVVTAECRLTLEEEAFLLGQCDVRNGVLDNRRKMVEALRLGQLSRVGELQFPPAPGLRGRESPSPSPARADRRSRCHGATSTTCCRRTDM